MHVRALPCRFPRPIAEVSVNAPLTPARHREKASRVTLSSLLECAETSAAARAATAVDRCACRVRRGDPDGGNIVAVIERLTDMPPGTVGFRAAGEIEREDYDEVLVPALHGALEAGAGLRTLYVIEDLDEVEPGALWADAKLGFDLGAGTTRSGFARPSSPISTGWRGRRGCSRG
jgi:hypothetical protein